MSEPTPNATSTPPTSAPPTSARRTGEGAGHADDPLRGSRTSGFWAAVVSLGVVLVLLIVFIAQNTQQQDVTFLAWTGRAPMAVLLLIAAAAGLFLSAAAGSLRILQLRRRVKREVKRSR